MTSRRWAGYGLETGVAWPLERDIDFQFGGYDLRADAITDETLPTIRIFFEEPAPYEDVFLVLNRCLSALAWVEKTYVRMVISGGGGAYMRFGRNGQGVVVSKRDSFPTLPEPTDDSALLALALYREALGVNSVPYQFLSFFKIINILHRTGPEQEAWIAQQLPSLTSHEALARISALARSPQDAATYLYEAGRCAIAHAFSSPIVDPDKVDDERRLSLDLPIIRELAETFMTNELGLT